MLTARRPTSISVIISLTSILTMTKGWYMNQPNDCEIMALRYCTMVLKPSFVNLIATVFFTLPTMIPARQKQIVRMRLSIQSNLQFGHILMVLHTWTTIESGYLLVTSISISSMMKLIPGYHFLARRSLYWGTGVPTRA